VIVYIIRNRINEKVYIGKTKGLLKDRWKAHLRNTKRKLDYPIYRAIRKYGADVFKVVQGRKGAENGHLARLRTPEHQKMAGLLGGQKNIESGHIQALGKIQGRKNVENGHFVRVSTFESRAKGGQASGRKKVESGEIYRMVTPQSCSKGAQAANHLRWHVKRKITDLACGLCFAADGGTA